MLCLVQRWLLSAKKGILDSLWSDRDHWIGVRFDARVVRWSDCFFFSLVIFTRSSLHNILRACHFNILVTEMLRHSLSQREVVCMTMFDTKGLSGWDWTIMTSLPYKHTWPLQCRFTLAEPLMRSKPICYGTRQNLRRHVSICLTCNPDKMEKCCSRVTDVGHTTYGCVSRDYARK